MNQASARERMERFAREFRNGDVEVALELIEGLLAEHPEQAPLHWQRARVLQSMGRLDEAREAIDRVLEMRPTHAPTWLMRAELVADADSSEAALRRAIEIDPRLARAHLLLARQLAHDGRRDEAEFALEQALRHDPHQPEAWTLRGDWHREQAALGVGKIDPGDPDMIAGVAGHRYSRTLLLAARADYETSLALKNDPRVRLWLALVLQGLGDHDAAIAHYDAVLALTPLDDPGREAIESERACSLDGGRGAQKVIERAYAEALAQEAEYTPTPAPPVASTPAPAPAAKPVPEAPL
ncbi:MAG: tetratricopeptide repeat protein, partial [Xanthomonadales bacterium PRO6]|nr:tetratricopeptide repeat protein [Xanthomonadales bacterium PRO6]